jgi:phosphatidylinositol alpha-1,6-mannosyltransferase
VTPLRVLYVSHALPPADEPLANVGGMQRVSEELYAALAAHPEVRLSTLLLRSPWSAVHRRVGPFLLRLLRDIPRVVERERIEVVVFYSTVTAALAVPLRRRLRALRARTVVIPNGLDVTVPSAPYQWFVPRLFRAMDGVLPISRATAEECLARGAAPEKVRVVPCGVDLGRFPPVEDRAATRRALLEALGEALPEDALLLCSVGRHVKRKGFAWFAEEVVPGLPEGVVYLLAGEGPETPRIRQVVREKGMEGRVRLLGRVSEERLATLYRGADLFVMPNVPVPGDMEGFGVVMLEAGLCGLPVLAAELEGIRDVVREGRNGHLLPSGDAGAFVEAVARYRRDRGALAALSESARRYVAETFSWRAVADRYVEALREVVSGDEGGQSAAGPLRRVG